MVVIAGPGYGKSTLLAQVVAGLEQPWAWCSLDERIDGPEPLLAHLVAGIGRQVPGFGAGVVLDGSPDAQVRELANEIASTILEDLVIVLDDAHLLRARAAVETLDLLLHDLPPTVHVLIASRVELPVSLGRLRPQGVTEIREADLALTRAESDALLAALGTRASPEDAARVHRLTEGWITGLLLAGRSPEAIRRLEEAGVLGRELAGYLADEVVGGQPEDVQEFLVRTAVLERFTPQIAAQVAGRDDAREVLRRLVDEHVFAVRLGETGEWYRYHHLFRALLRRRLEERDEGERSALHRRAAEAWLAFGEPEEAVRHYLAAGELAQMVQALEPVAERMLRGGESETLARWIEAIPPELFADSPGLVLAHGSALFSRARYPEAFTALERALDELVARGDGERAAVAVFRYLRALALAGGQQERGIEAARRYLARLDPAARDVAPARIVLAQLLAESCRYEEAEAELRAVAELPRGASPLVRAYAAATRAFSLDLPRGAPGAAVPALDAAIAEIARHEAEDTLHFMAYARAYRAVALNDAGRYDEALAEAQRVRESVERSGLGRIAAPVVAWLRFDALGGLGRLGELGAEVAATAAVFARIGNAARGYAFHVAAARLAAAAGDAAAVEARISAARAGLRAHGHPFDEARVLADLAGVAWHAGLAGTAAALARDARELARSAASPWAEARAALLGALAASEEGEADDLLAGALALVARHGLDELVTAKERRLAEPLLTRALARGLGPEGAAARLARAAGVLRRAGPPRPRRARPVLRLVTLGGFRVLRDGVEISEAEFERQKARVLLAVLLCAGAPVHRETLVEELWPRLPLDRGVAALNSTLYVLRRVLEPGLSRSRPSSVVVAEGASYRLVLSPEDEWDARRFLELAAPDGDAAGVADVARLQEAEAAWGGPFLPEWPYADWAAPLRAELEEAHRGVLERLAEALAASGQPGAAISRYRRLLAIEPEREGYHRGLMRVFAQAGERALALRQYHACRAILRQRLGIEPSRETRDLYTRLLREDGGA